MKCLFLKDVPSVARAGEIREVSDGYARNYLIPRGLAVAATPAVLRQWEERRQAEQRRQEREAAHARQLATKLEGTPVRVTARAGPEGRLFGAVTAADLAQALSAQLGQQLDRRQVELEEPLHETGSYTVPVRLGPGVTARVTVVVEAATE
jgi:large subunit ribosomal protein L9